MLLEFSDWLSRTSLSVFVTESTRLETWLIVPVSQTIHILAVGIVMIAAGVLNLRLLGIGPAGQSFGRLSTQLTPWIWGALAVLLATGILQTIAEPAREIMNNLFRLKLVMLLIVVAIAILYRAQIKTDLSYWERSRGRLNLARMLAVVSLVLWTGIAVEGRLIAYFGAIE